MKVMYMRKVNPNRVSLGTELVIDEQGGATVSFPPVVFLIVSFSRS